MSDTLKPAYCPNCLKNVPHRRYIRSAGGRWLDRHLGKWLLRLRLGPWYCIHCESRQLVLAAARPEAVDYELVAPDEIPERPTRRPPGSTANDGGTEVIGNFLKTDQSLVHRSQLRQRFSTHFRDSLVDRLLAGGVTLAQLKAEQQVSEREILDWIADRLRRAEGPVLEQAPGTHLLPALDPAAEDHPDSAS